ERSHRRLIETNVQLLSLREVAGSMATTVESDETTRTVTRYLCRAFGFEEVFLLLVERDSARLRGTWTHGGGGREKSIAVDLPIQGEAGAVARALWLNRTLVHHHAVLHPPLVLPDGHALQERLADLGSFACVPLLKSH